jgi:hypothetical protein
MTASFEAECLVWDGAVNNHGYGTHCEWEAPGKYKTKYAHRTAYEAFYGPIGEGKILRHTCNNRRCINPLHLVEGGNSENMLDSVAAGTHANARKTHCPQGHPYDSSNTTFWAEGKRRCRTCLAARKRTNTNRVA